MELPASSPRDALINLVGASLPAGALEVDGARLFVLDGEDRFLAFDPELASLYEVAGRLEVGETFRADFAVPCGLVAAAIGAARTGRASDLTLVVPRAEAARNQIWRFEAFPLVSPHAPDGRGVVCMLVRVDSVGVSDAGDTRLGGAELAERLARERRDTAQAVLVAISHEINNALTSLIGNAELILRREAIEAQTEARIREIVAQGRRIQGVLERLKGLEDVRTTSYLGGVEMLDLAGEDPDDAK